MINKEELLVLLDDEDVQEKIKTLKSLRGTQEVREFKAEISKWIEESDESIREKNNVRNSLYGVLKTKLGIKSMNALEDSQVAKTREIFEQYKEFIS